MNNSTPPGAGPSGPSPALRVPSGLPGLRWPGLPDATMSQVLALAYQFEHSQWWPAERLRAEQFRQAAQLIRHARRTCPFYEERLAAWGDLGDDDLTPERFLDIPPLGRRTLQEHAPELRSQAPPPSHGRPFEARTSGSTGSPVVFRGAPLSALFLWALSLRDHTWHRRDFDGSHLAMRAMHPGSIEARPEGWARGVVTGPSRAVDITRPVEELLEILLDDDPDYLQVHPYTLDAIVRRSAELGRRPARLRQVRCYGEVLEPGVRRRCEGSWGVPIVDTYSTEEAGIVALQCPESGLLHAQSESLIVEVLDDDGRPCSPGQVGRVAVTVLHNFAMPLIRYTLGDLAEVGPPCPCGRGLPTLSRVLGRARHLVVHPDGSRVQPVFDEAAMLAIADIRQYQLTQVSTEAIEVTLAAPRPLDQGQRGRLASLFDRAFRHRFRYDFARVEEIPRSTRGKYEVFRSRIAP